MNKENPYRDQAERLRQRIDKVQEPKNQAAGLPPRSELHRHQRKRTKWKLEYPVIRLLVLFFILLPIVSFSVYSYLSGSKNGKAVKATVDSKGYETINFEKAKPKEKQSSQKEKTAKPDSPQNERGNAGKNESKPNENPAPASPNTTSSLNTNGNPVNGEGNNALSRTVPNENKVVYHTVKPQETIYRIAMNYYHSKAGVAIIKQANNIQTNSIIRGQVLKIPLTE